MHGHSYTLIVTLRRAVLESSGPKKNMVADFGDISSIVKPMVNTYFDHHWLNETIETDNPTVEYIAQWIFHHLKEKLPHLYSITIKETRTAQVTYYGPERNS